MVSQRTVRRSPCWSSSGGRFAHCKALCRHVAGRLALQTGSHGAKLFAVTLLAVSRRRPVRTQQNSLPSRCWPSLVEDRFARLKTSSLINDENNNNGQANPLLRTHTTPPQSPALLLPTLAEHSLFLVIIFFRALNPTSLLFPTLHNFPALPFLPASFSTGQF